MCLIQASIRVLSVHQRYVRYVLCFLFPPLPYLRRLFLFGFLCFFIIYFWYAIVGYLFLLPFCRSSSWTLDNVHYRTVLLPPRYSASPAILSFVQNVVLYNSVLASVQRRINFLPRRRWYHCRATSLSSWIFHLEKIYRWQEVTVGNTWMGRWQNDNGIKCPHILYS